MIKNIVVAIYLGESYAEIKAVEAKTINSKQNPNQNFYHKSFFLPQNTLKNILIQNIKPLVAEGHKIEKVFVVTRYFDRLKTFRLGGSVIQVINKNFENSYSFESSKNLSLAANSLIISVDEKSTLQDIETDLTKIKKINPDANKVVLSFNSSSEEFKKSILDFFKQKDFLIFENAQHDSQDQLRKTLIQAGTEGTKSEIIKDIQENLGTDQIYFWIDQQFSLNPQNTELFFSADQFLNSIRKQNKKQKLVHFDIERFIVMNDDTLSSWNSPWGNMNLNHPQVYPLSLQPFQEITVDTSGLLRFSDQPANIEPGPMIAGRSTKTLLLDVFYKQISQNPKLLEIFNQAQAPALINKIESQFKALEKSQRTSETVFGSEMIQHFFQSLIETQLNALEINKDQTAWTGNMVQHFTESKTEHFSWCDEILNKVYHL